MAALAVATPQRSWLPTAVVTALIAGTFDITYAIVFSYLRSGVAPSRLLQSVAAGALGRDAAFAGGTPTAALGLGLHFLIAFIITLVFFAAASWRKSLVTRPVLIGSVYGIGVYVVMNFIVIPLSRIGPRPLPAAIVTITGVLVHMFLIGTPIAIGARRAILS